VAVVKRRIVSAMVRHEALERGDDPEDVTALGPEDAALVANPDAVKKLISDREYKTMRDEMEALEHDTLCKLTFMDQNFDIVRNVPSDFRAFHEVAKLVPPEDYWDTFDFVLSRYKGSSRLYEIAVMIRKTVAVVISVFLSRRPVSTQAWAMMVIVLLSFAFHVRIRPYDDQNSSVRTSFLV